MSHRSLRALCLGTIVAAAVGAPGVWADEQARSPAGSVARPAGVKPPAKVLAVLEQAEKSAANIEDEAQQAFALMKVATAWARLGQFRQAGRVFEQAATTAEAIEEPSPQAYRRGAMLSMIAKAQADVGEFRAALKMAERSTTPSVGHRESALAHVSLAQAKAGDLGAAMETVALIREGSQSFAWKLIAEHQMQAGDFKGARKTADQITDASYKVQALAILAPAQAKAGQKDQAEEALRTALEHYKSMSDANPDIETSPKAYALMWITRAWVQMGDEERAADIGEPLKSSHWQEQVTAEIALARFRAGKVAEALAMVKPFRGSWKEDTLRAMARVQIGARDFKAARTTIEMMGFSIPKTEAFLQMAAEHLKQGDVAAAKAVFEELMASAGKHGDTLWTGGPMSAGPIILHQAMVGWAEADAKAALAWAENVESAFVRAYAFAGVAEGMSKAKPGGESPAPKPSGQAPKTSGLPPKQGTEPIVIRGRVVDHGGRAVPKAELWLPCRSEREVHGRADDRGEYELTVPRDSLPLAEAQSRWTLWGYARGHAVGMASARAVLWEGVKDRLELRLGTTTTTSFVILDPDGKPVRGAVVAPHAIHPSLELFPSRLASLLTSGTDDAGRASLPTVAAKDLYIVRVVSKEHGTQDRRFAPTANKPADPAENTIRLRAVGRVEGRVLADKPEWVRGIKFECVSTNGRDYWVTGTATVESDAEGTFVVPRIAAGRLFVREFLDKRLPVRPVLPTTELLAGETTTLEIQLVPGVLLRGRVQVADSGKPLAGAHVSVAHQNARQTDEAQTDAEGRFEVRVLPGLITPTVHLPKTEAQLIQRWGASRRVPVGVDRFDLPIEFVKATRHEGRLIDNEGKPMADAWVFSLIGGDIVNRATTGRDGKFSILLPADFESFTALVKGVRYEAALEKTDPLVLKLPAAIK